MQSAQNTQQQKVQPQQQQPQQQQAQQQQAQKQQQQQQQASCEESREQVCSREEKEGKLSSLQQQSNQERPDAFAQLASLFAPSSALSAFDPLSVSAAYPSTLGEMLFRDPFQRFTQVLQRAVAASPQIVCDIAEKPQELSVVVRTRRIRISPHVPLTLTTRFPFFGSPPPSLIPGPRRRTQGMLDFGA